MKTLGMFLQENKTREAVTRDISKIKDFMECLLDTVKMRIAMLAVCQMQPLHTGFSDHFILKDKTRRQ